MKGGHKPALSSPLQILLQMPFWEILHQGKGERERERGGERKFALPQNRLGHQGRTASLSSAALLLCPDKTFGPTFLMQYVALLGTSIADSLQARYLITTLGTERIHRDEVVRACVFGQCFSSPVCNQKLVVLLRQGCSLFLCPQGGSQNKINTKQHKSHRTQTQD